MILYWHKKIYRILTVIRQDILWHGENKQKKKDQHMDTLEYKTNILYYYKRKQSPLPSKYEWQLLFFLNNDNSSPALFHTSPRQKKV